MNRNDRSRLMIAARTYLSLLREHSGEFRKAVSDTLDAEEAKLVNLPPAFDDSSLHSSIEEGISSMADAIELVDSILDEAEGIPDLLGIVMKKPHSKPKQRLNVFIEDDEPMLPLFLPEKRSERLQVLTTPSLVSALREYADENRISVNEVINRLLTDSLLERVVTADR